MGMDMNTPLTIFFGLIGLVVLFSGAAVILPLVLTAGNSINSTGAPLASLFASNSVFPIVLMAGLLGGSVYLGVRYATGKRK